eukprot:scaffold2266_cov62-Phaeocystis_antarctica.AAC.2
MVEADALREQAREVLVSAARCIEPPTPAASHVGPHLLPPLPPPARPPQGQEVRPAAKKEPATKGPTAAGKKETAHASCRRLPPPANASD